MNLALSIASRQANDQNFLGSPILTSAALVAEKLPRSGVQRNHFVRMSTKQWRLLVFRYIQVPWWIYWFSAPWRYLSGNFWPLIPQSIPAFEYLWVWHRLPPLFFIIGNPYECTVAPSTTSCKNMLPSRFGGVIGPVVLLTLRVCFDRLLFWKGFRFDFPTTHGLHIWLLSSLWVFRELRIYAAACG